MLSVKLIKTGPISKLGAFEPPSPASFIQVPIRKTDFLIYCKLNYDQAAQIKSLWNNYLICKSIDGNMFSWIMTEVNINKSTFEALKQMWQKIQYTRTNKMKKVLKPFYGCHSLNLFDKIKLCYC